MMAKLLLIHAVSSITPPSDNQRLTELRTKTDPSSLMHIGETGPGETKPQEVKALSSMLWIVSVEISRWQIVIGIFVFIILIMISVVKASFQCCKLVNEKS